MQPFIRLFIRYRAIVLIIFCVMLAAGTFALTRLDKALRNVRIGRTRRHLVSAHPMNAIPALARTIHSDIVVLGAVSRTGFKRLLIGNTAERIIDDLTCDVLVVKPQDFATRVRRAGRGMRRA